MAAASLESSTSQGWKLWLGRVLSALAGLALVFAGAMKLQHPPQMVEIFTQKFGYQASVLGIIGPLEIAAGVLSLIPQTALLGVVLMTGYLGGAIATHVRISDPQWVGPLLIALLAWAGLFLREPRLWVLLPLRRLK
jgi:hypothetical protein